MKRVIQMVIIGVLGVFSPAHSSVQSLAQSTGELLQQMQEQIQNLQQRVTDLENQNAELKKQLSIEDTKPAAPTIESLSPETPLEKEAVPTTEIKSPHDGLFSAPKVTSDYPIDIYGRLQWDASYDDSRTNQGNFSRWVLPETTNSGDDQFNTTGSRTRLGMRITGPDFYAAQTTGLVEGDFFGGGDDNKPRFRLRHGFVQLHYPQYDLSFLAGQTYDIFSPLFPPTVNFTTGFWVGNIGFRRAQFRVTKNWNIQEDTKFTAVGGFSRTIGDLTGFDPGDTGEDAGFPTLQGRIAYTSPLWLDSPATIGLSGHWGQEEYDFDVFGNHHDLDTWSANLDLTLPIYDKYKVTSEWWVGENLDTYVGGINQGVNPLTLEEVGAWGGWAALTMGPWYDVRYNIGATLDNPENGDLNGGGRSQNESYFANSIWQMNQALQMGLEFSYWKTEYIGLDEGDSFRVQTSVKYKF